MAKNLHQRIKEIIAPLSSLERAVYFFTEGVRLHVLYGMILTTPIKEIKRMKLRQIEKELKALAGPQGTSLEESFGRHFKALRLCGIYGLISTTPAKEIKKLKLRQVKKELEELVAKQEKEE